MYPSSLAATLRGTPLLCSSSCDVLLEHADETGIWCQAGSKLSAAEAQAKAAARMQWRAGMERKSRLVASGGTSADHLAKPVFVNAEWALADTARLKKYHTTEVLHQGRGVV